MKKRKYELTIREYASLPGFSDPDFSTALCIMAGEERVDEKERRSKREVLEEIMKYAYVLGYRAGTARMEEERQDEVERLDKWQPPGRETR